jgi:hypothetical protein
MQMKTTMADDCFPLDSLGALLPFSVLHKTTPTTGAPFASEFHHLVSSFCFVSTHTHTHTHTKPPIPNSTFRLGIYLYTFSRLSCRYLVLSRNMVQVESTSNSKTWLVRATGKAWSRSFRGCVLRCKTNVSIIVKDTNSNYHSHNNGRNVYMRNISMSNKCLFVGY